MQLRPITPRRSPAGALGECKMLSLFATLGEKHVDDDLVRHARAGGFRLEIIDVLAVDVHGDAAADLADVGVRDAVGEVDLGGHLHNLVLTIHLDTSNTAPCIRSQSYRSDRYTVHVSQDRPYRTEQISDWYFLLIRIAR